MLIENSVRLMLPRQNEKFASKVEKEVDEGPLRKGESFGSKSSRRAMALGGVAGLLASYPVAAEVNLNSKNAIVVEGEMPSQKALGSEMAGVIIEEDGLGIESNQVVPVEIVNNTETILIDAEKGKEANQRVSDYLSGEGSNDDEELKKRTFYFYDSLSKADLGFCGVDSNNILVQGILLGHFQKNDRDFLIVGVKDVTGKRKVSVIEWLIDKTIDAYSVVPVLKMDGYYSSASFEVEKMSSVEEARSFLESKTNDVVVFNLYNLTEEKVSEKEYQNLGEKKLNFYLNYVVPRWKDSINFVSGLLKPSFKKLKMFASEVNIIKSLKEKELFSVSSYDEAINMSDSELNNTPLLSIIQYNTNLR